VPGAVIGSGLVVSLVDLAYATQPVRQPFSVSILAMFGLANCHIISIRIPHSRRRTLNFFYLPIDIPVGGSPILCSIG
jgi:hypothetical protein